MKKFWREEETLPRTKNVTKKTATRKNNSKKNIQAKEEILLSEDQVKELLFDFQTFSQQLNRGGGLYPSVINPLLLNQRLQDVALNPVAATQDKLDQALSNPKGNEDTLLGISEWFEIQSQSYKRLISYLSDLLSWDLTYTCINVTEKDYKTPAYKKDLETLDTF